MIGLVGSAVSLNNEKPKTRPLRPCRGPTICSQSYHLPLVCVVVELSVQLAHGDGLRVEMKGVHLLVTLALHSQSLKTKKKGLTFDIRVFFFYGEGEKNRVDVRRWFVRLYML